MGKVVILGTAHGSNVAGKRSPGGELLEWEYSRKVVASVKAELEALGYMVLVDIPEAVVPSPQSAELKKRASVVNNICAKYGTENCVYVSIHVNGAGNKGEWEDAGGWCCFTTRGVTKSDKLASCLYDVAGEELVEYARKLAEGKAKGVYSKRQTAVRKDYSDGDADWESNFYVIYRTACPAVLTENCFQDNRWDVDFLLSEGGFRAIVNIHVKGIDKYLGGNGGK